MQYEKALRIAQHSINASETFEFSGRWRNRHATILELKTKGPELDGLCRVAESGFVHTGEKTAVLKGFVMGDLIGFTALYGVLGVICFRLTRRIARTGPDPVAPPADAEPTTRPDDELSLV